MVRNHRKPVLMRRGSTIPLSKPSAKLINAMKVPDESSDFYDSEEDYSNEEYDGDQSKDLYSAGNITLFSRYLNKGSLLFPLVTSIVFRSIASSDFRAIAIAWAVILCLTSDISMDEGTIPALVTASLGCGNAVVAQNMYISIARSRSGLLALASLSYYSSNYQILVCGISSRVMVSFSNMLLQGSIPKSEITLICGGIVNAIWSSKDAPRGDIYNPSAIITAGISAAIPLYPLSVRFTKNYKLSHGRAKQPKSVAAIYICYFAIAIYSYFFVFGMSIKSVGGALKDNLDVIMYWTIVLCGAISIAYTVGHRIGLDGRRKSWHLSAVLLFLPQFVRERKFTQFALAAAIVSFVALEVARATASPPFGVPLHKSLQNFIDHRDKRGPVIISHIYLLLGIAMPIFLNKSAAGVICLGLGDTLASQIGRKFGRFRIFGHKSIEGCVAFALAAGTGLFLSDLPSENYSIAIPTALLEAVTPLNDNSIVPMYMSALQGIFMRSAAATA